MTPDFIRKVKTKSGWSHHVEFKTPAGRQIHVGAVRSEENAGSSALRSRRG